MILVNHTLSFANEIECEAKNWIQNTYKPLLEACPHTHEVLFCKLTSDAEVADTYVLQIRFSHKQEYEKFQHSYEQDFLHSLFLKFNNNFGIFSSTLEQISL